MFTCTHDRNTSAKNDREKVKSTISSLPSKLKVEMRTLQISEESEQQLYDSLIHIYGNVNVYSYLLSKCFDMFVIP